MRFCGEKIRGDRSIAAAIDYVKDNSKTKGLIKAINCSPENTWASIELTRQLHRTRNIREYKHIILSFYPGEEVDPEKVLKLAENIMGFYEGYQSICAVHQSGSRCVHFHAILSCVHPATGKALSLSPRDINNFWRHSIQEYQALDFSQDDVSSRKMRQWLQFLKQSVKTDPDEEIYEIEDESILYPDLAVNKKPDVIQDWYTGVNLCYTANDCFYLETEPRLIKPIVYLPQPKKLISPIEYVGKGEKAFIRPIEYIDVEIDNH